MKLHQYMERKKLDDETVALAIGWHRATVCRWRLGTLNPSFEAARAIRDFTRGKVGFDDWGDITSGGKSCRNGARSVARGAVG